MCARLLLRGGLDVWLMPTHLLQSSLLTSKLKCLFIVPSKNKKHRGAALHMAASPKAGRGKRSGVTLRMAAPPKAGRGKRRGVTVHAWLLHPRWEARKETGHTHLAVVTMFLQSGGSL